MKQGQKEIAACAESRFFPLFATNFMYSLMYSLLKVAVSRFLGKIIAIFFCPWYEIMLENQGLSVAIVRGVILFKTAVRYGVPI